MRGDEFLGIGELNGRNPRFGNASAEQIRAQVPELSLSSLLPHRPRIFNLSPPAPHLDDCASNSQLNSDRCSTKLKND